MTTSGNNAKVILKRLLGTHSSRHALRSVNDTGASSNRIANGHAFTQLYIASLLQMKHALYLTLRLVDGA
jgi:hypothetical protein